MSIIDDLFKNIESLSEGNIYMSSEDFISKTKNILNRINDIHSECHWDRRLSDEETESLECNEHNSCTVVINDEKVECFLDHYEGDCFVREFDSDLFKEELEQLMFDSNDFFDLLSCEIEDFKLGDKVYHDSDEAPFELVGITKTSLKLKGDWSGGTHNVIQSSWVDISKVRKNK